MVCQDWEEGEDITFTTPTQHVQDIPVAATREINKMHTDQEGRMKLSLSADDVKAQRNLQKTPELLE